MKFEEFEIKGNKSSGFTLPEKKSAGASLSAKKIIESIVRELDGEGFYTADIRSEESSSSFLIPEKKDYKETAPKREAEAGHGIIAGKSAGEERYYSSEINGGNRRVSYTLPEKFGAKQLAEGYRKLKHSLDDKFRLWKAELESTKTPENDAANIFMYIYEAMNSSDDVRIANQKLSELKQAFPILEQKEEAVRQEAKEFISEQPASRVSFTLPENNWNKSLEEIFMSEAMKYRDVIGEKCAFVPLRCYMPTHDRLAEEQLGYYLYWRSEFKKGNCLKTSHAYIQLYAFELLNNIGVDSEEGFSRLKELYYAYREEDTMLDQQFPAWLLDYKAYYGIDSELSDIVKNASEFIYGDNLERLLEYAFEQKPLCLNYSLIKLLSDYDPASNKFYQENSEAITAYVPKLLALIDSYEESKTGKRFVDDYKNMKRRRDRTLFQNAIFCYKRVVKNKELYTFAGNMKLRAYITEFMRASENILREELGFKTRLRNVSFNPELLKLMKAYIKRELHPPKAEEKPEISIEIDERRLGAAISDAEHTVEILSLKNDFIEKFEYTEAEHRLIEFFREKGKSIPEAELYKFDREFILTMDSANEKSLANTDKLLFTERNGVYSMSESTAEKLVQDMPEADLRYEARDTDKEAPLAMQSSAEPEEQENPFTKSEREYIAAALLGDDAKMAEISENEGSMTELFEEEINIKAEEAFGDILIESGSIIEDYAELARRIAGVN